MSDNLRKAAQAALEALDAAMPIIQYDAQMMADITRHAPLDPESQAKHDSTEYESERLIRTIPQLIDALRAELGLPSVGQVVNEIQAERLSIERACGLGDRIAPCPFCGSENVELICSGSAWFVECRECQATGPMLVDGEDRDSIRAVELWAIPPRTRHPLSGKSESIAPSTKDVPPL